MPQQSKRLEVVPLLHLLLSVLLVQPFNALQIPLGPVLTPSSSNFRLPRAWSSFSSAASSSWALSSNIATASSSPTPVNTEKLCKNCKTYFNPIMNHDRACRYHPKHYSGDTKRKADWSDNADRFGTQKMYWCCGEEDEKAPGCKYDRHRSYDDE